MCPASHSRLPCESARGSLWEGRVELELSRSQFLSCEGGLYAAQWGNTALSAQPTFKMLAAEMRHPEGHQPMRAS